MLRGCYNGDHLSFDAQGNLIGTADTVPFSLCAVRVDTVQLTDSSLEITGTREGLEFRDQGGSGGQETVTAAVYDKHNKVDVMIARDAGAPDQLDAVLARVFSIGIDDALAASAPDYWQPWLHFALHPDDAPYRVAGSGAPVIAGHAEGGSRVKNRMIAPQLVDAPDIQFSAAARRLHYQGTVLIGLIVDASGLPQHIFIARPLGMGLDEKAVENMQRYRFRPATYQGKPVAVEIMIQISCRIY